MRAIVRDSYGPPDVLRLEEIPLPTPGDNEVLVRVRAAAVNKGDWEILRGSPIWVRLVGFGLIKPKTQVLGSNFSGQIETVGRNVSQFAAGDEICGDLLSHGLGAFSEYVCVPEDAAIVRKPANVTFEEAASVPEAGLIALQGIRDKGRLKSGQKILINGAGGGAGSFAIQLAKSVGAEVTAIDSQQKLEFMRSLGADHVVDYAQKDYNPRGENYDLILDVVGIRSIAFWKHALAPNGVYVSAGGTVTQIARTLAAGAWVSRTTEMKIGVLGVSFNKEDLSTVMDLLASGKIAATIERCYPLENVPDALRHLGAGHSKGKLVISPAGRR